MAFVGAPGERIAYHIYEGPFGAPPLLLIHGFTASAASFLSNIAGLREHFTVITCDLLGHGDSDAPEDPALYGPGFAVDRIADLLDELDYDDVLLCGHSLGAALALRFALDQPHRVAGLILINSNSAAGTPEWRESARPGLLALARQVREQGLDPLRDSRLFPAASRRLPPEAREQLTRDFDRLSPEGVAGTAESLTADVNAWERLPELRVPTLVVIGDRDQNFVDAAPAFLERLPAEYTRWIVLEGAGHAANLEAPGEFNAAVAAFAEEIGYVMLPPSARRRALNTGMMVLGAALVSGGIGLLVAAFLVDGGSQDTSPEAIAGGPTPTPFEQVAGERTPGPDDPGGVMDATPEPTPTTPFDDATPDDAEIPSDEEIADTPTPAEGGALPAPTPTPTSVPPTPTSPPPATPTPTSPPPATPTPTPTPVQETPTPQPPTPTPTPATPTPTPGLETPTPTPAVDTPTPEGAPGDDSA